MTSPTLFVAGASGKLGRRVVELLLERGHDGKIIVGSRTPEKLPISPASRYGRPISATPPGLRGRSRESTGYW